MPCSWIAERAEAKHGCQCYNSDVVFQPRERKRARGAQTGSLRGCARKAWLEARFQCHLWKAFPGGDAGELAEEREAEEDATVEESLEGSEDEERRRRRRRSLRDADGVYYVGDAAKVHQHLGVEHYAKAMPRIPVEELHASSVQHPRFPAYRWLLHTRRVPTRPQEAGGASHPAGIAESAAARGRGRDDGGDGAAEPVIEPGPDSSALPRCAGVGVEESKVWICRKCRDALCVRHGISMPGPALANLMWGGREHPTYQDISEATSVLLGRGRLVYPKDHFEDRRAGRAARRPGWKLHLAHPT